MLDNEYNSCWAPETFIPTGFINKEREGLSSTLKLSFILIDNKTKHAMYLICFYNWGGRFNDSCLNSVIQKRFMNALPVSGFLVLKSNSLGDCIPFKYKHTQLILKGNYLLFLHNLSLIVFFDCARIIIIWALISYNYKKVVFKSLMK